MARVAFYQLPPIKQVALKRSNELNSPNTLPERRMQMLKENDWITRETVRTRDLQIIQSTHGLSVAKNSPELQHYVEAKGFVLLSTRMVHS